ncbi:hypothetical protein FS749_001155 [Ceratobasidium sp. UAMH 11750]|nr:hypothetical protein FS749_001155 [Ceratobasidium sp. UAMH 11750]
MASPATTTTHVSTRSREEMVSAARKKLKTFRAKQAHSPMSSLGNHVHRRSHSRGSSMSSVTDSVPSAPVASEATRHQKRRSHSRSASILDLNNDNGLHSVPLPSLTFKNQLESSSPNLGGLNRSFSFGGPKSRPASAAPAMLPMPTSPVRAHHQQNASRSRSSHHRRRSSVSTRRDSVDMMGFDPASLKPAGEKDKDDVTKVRERALLALEGKAPRPGKARTVPEILPHMGFSKVEIPEWKTPDVERSFDWTMSNNAKSAPFSLGSNGALAGKRDSFGKALVPSVSTKAELAVLVEEEEEELVDAKEDTTQVSVPLSVPEPVLTPMVESPTTESHPTRTTSPSRPRPASLNLKALALAASATVALPTPSATPSPTPPPRSLPGMKPLNLGNAVRRKSMVAVGSSSRNSLPPSRRQSLRSESRGSDSPCSSRDSLVNRLPPTPNTTSPTSMNSAAGIEGFLQKNQEVLVSRIEQLEKALAKSQRMSLESDASGTTSSLVEDQITLIAELRNERNTLVEEIAGWRTRVEDLERQAALYVKRVDSERHECSVMRERVHELEAERRTWEAGRLAQEETIARARDDTAAWRAKYEEASKGECHWQAKAVNLESDVRRLEMELAAARRQIGPVAPPNKRWNPMAPRRFDGSVSSASTTDVDEAASYASGDMDAWKMKPRAPSPLPNMDVVVEEEEEVYEDSYEEPCLDEDADEESHCVEEDEDDVASDILDEVNGALSASCSMGSFASPNPQRTETQPAPSRSELSPNFTFPPPAPAPSHARTGSMVKGWQMPRGPVAVKPDAPTKPDRFFDQLEHLYASSEEDLPPASLPSPEFGTFKGDGGASAFTFGTKRNTVMGSTRGHGTRASRTSISLGAFDGLGLPPFMNPKPEWIVKSEPTEPAAAISPAIKANAASPISLKNTAQNKPGVSDSAAYPQEQGSLVGDSRAAPRVLAHEVHSPSSDASLTPKMAKLPTFTPAPTTPTTPTRVSNIRTLMRRKPSLTRAQPTGRAPPRVPFDPSYDNKPRSPFSVSYSRTSSRSSKSRLSIAEAEAIEAAIEQARAQALAQQPRLTLAGLTSLIPWGRGTGGATKSVPARDEEREEQKPLVARKESGTVSREVQLARLRREMQAGKTSSGPCCSRCKSDVIQL